MCLSSTRLARLVTCPKAELAQDTLVAVWEVSAGATVSSGGTRPTTDVPAPGDDVNHQLTAERGRPVRHALNARTVLRACRTSATRR